tara:strand:+ start:2706 stop:3197 length:492 start_codon:yes stop_codon:yes gene_type:complete
MANARSYSFSSVGETVEEYRQSNRIEDLVGGLTPVGIKTPLELGGEKDGLLVMNWTTPLAIKDNLKNLLLTNHGERLGMYDFGANLQELLFELGTDDFDKEAMTRISKAVAKYMPYVSLEGFETVTEGTTSTGLSMIGIRVTYSVTLASVTDQMIEIILYSAG